ncbi:MAG: DUF4349 domain-containing protein [Bacteroidota bacterium]
MNNKIKYFLFVIAAFVISSCATRSYSPAYDSGSYRGSRNVSDNDGFRAFRSNGDFMGVAGKMENADISGGDKANFMDGKKEDGIDKKIVYNASCDLKVKKVDTANAQLKRIAEKFDGYAQSLGPRTSVIRVKSANLNAAIAEIAKFGKQRNKSLYGNDVTEQYYDLALRLDNYERARIRYNELLAKASNVDEMLKVEKELERVNREIELLKGKLNLLKNQVDYSTITVYLTEKRKLGILGYIFKGMYVSVKWLFVR